MISGFIFTRWVPIFVQAFKMVLIFEDDTLVSITGDYVPTTAEEKAQKEAEEKAQQDAQEAATDTARRGVPGYRRADFRL